MTERSVQRQVQIGTKLTAAAKEAARGTVVEKSTSKLLEVARLPEEEQPDAVRRMIEESLHPTPREPEQKTTEAPATSADPRPDFNCSTCSKDGPCEEKLPGTNRCTNYAVRDNAEPVLPAVYPALRERYIGALEDLHEAVRVTEDGEDVTVETLRKVASSLTAMAQGRLASWMDRLANRWARAEAARKACGS